MAIPGGATSIGFGFAKAFGAEAAKIVLAARRERRLQEAVSELEILGIEATYTVSDVTKPKQVEALADFAWDWKGHVDVIINNAGMMLPNMLVTDTPQDSVHNIFNLSVKVMKVCTDGTEEYRH